jgi:hypothetical protein
MNEHKILQYQKYRIRATIEKGKTGDKLIIEIILKIPLFDLENTFFVGIIFETSLMELKAMKKKWFAGLLAIWIVANNIVGIAVAEDSPPYTYEGDVDSNGVYQGEGKLYYQGQLFYEGDFVDGNFNGEGTLYYVKKTDTDDSSQETGLTNRVKYQGQFKNGLYHGKGTLYYNFSLPVDKKSDYAGQKYEGKFRYGKYYGYGIEYTMKGEIKNKGYFIDGTLYDYEGPTDENGKMHGVGKLLNNEGQVVFEGNFIHGEIHGKGTMYLNDKRTIKYVGNFVHDRMEGEGSLYKNDILYYKGDFEDGMKQGKGTIYFPDLNIAYQGEFINDRTKEQPFQIKSEIHLDSKLNGTYSVYVVLLDKYTTESTLKHFKDMRETAEKNFDSIKDVSKESSYQAFIATKDMGNILESNFQDKFLGFQTTVVKTKMMFVNQFEIFSRLSFSFDPNLMNINHELYLPENSRDIKVNQVAQQMNSDTHYVWMDIQNEDYLTAQFQLYNPYTIIITIIFIMVLIGGIIYFHKKDHKEKLET